MGAVNVLCYRRLDGGTVRAVLTAERLLACSTSTPTSARERVSLVRSPTPEAQSRRMHPTLFPPNCFHTSVDALVFLHVGFEPSAVFTVQALERLVLIVC